MRRYCAEPGLGGPIESHVNRPSAAQGRLPAGRCGHEIAWAVLANHFLLVPPADLFLSSSRAPLRMSAKP